MFKITTGSEAVSNIKVTWTKDDGDGSSISETTVANATNASTTVSYTQNRLD